jgi:hypothetical protein
VVFLPLLKLDSIRELSFLETSGKKLKIHLLSSDRIVHSIFTETQYDADITGLFRSLPVRGQAGNQISLVRVEQHELDSESGIQYRSQTRYTDIGFVRGRQEQIDGRPVVESRHQPRAARRADIDRPQDHTGIKPA